LLFPDTHAHLDQAFDGDLDAVLERAREAGVDRVLAVGSDLRSSQKAVAIAGTYAAVYAGVGIHPHEARRFEEEGDGIRALLGAPKVVAVGEIGLDYYRELAPRHMQRKAFREQLIWARERGLPVSVHNRSADDDILAALGTAGVTSILHCFSGTWEMARVALGQGHFLSFAGNVTYPRATDLREIAARVPTDRMLVESDAPVLAPQQWRGRRNEPGYVRATLAALASVKGMPFEHVASLVEGNADRVFSWRGA